MFEAFNIPDAHAYFAGMVLIMLPLAAVHMVCFKFVRRYPAIMPDARQRGRYAWGEASMAFTCLAMLWYMWKFLPWMVSICAADPWFGFWAHIPWIAGSLAVFLAKSRHMMRLIEQVRGV